VDIQNNFAQLSLLLNVDVDRARTLARRLYEAHSTNANCASTYAYALYSQGHFDQAAKVMNGLKDDDLKRPEIAAYYGAILASAGARQKAEQFLALSRTAHLLPEEKKIVEEAVARP
jgi:predicted Zn-dependent protease